MFCRKCGVALKPNAKFCAECGAKVEAVVAPPVPSEPAPPATPKISLPEVDFAAITGEALAKTKNLGKRALGAFNKNAKRNYSIIGGVLLVAIYGIVQLSMLGNSGPQNLADKYIAAVSGGSNAALSDETLFPNPEGLEYAPKGIDPEAYATGSLTSSLFSNDATIKLVGPNGDDLGTVKLKGEDHWNFIFRTRTWQVVTPASSISIGNPDVAALQGFSYGRVNFKNLSAEGFAGFSGKKYLAIPGTYEVSTRAFGFNDSSSDTVILKVDDSATLQPVKSTSLAIADAQTGAATSKAEAKSRACVKSSCASMPYFSESDFYFSGSDPSDDWYYDYSYSSKSYSAGSCTLSSSQALSALKATFSYDCDVSANITVTHVVDYYYLTDDYSYYYGTASDYMTIRVTMVFDPKTGKFKLS